eukprot:177490-Amorphochlora_amoeboformis.AAC.2
MNAHLFGGGGEIRTTTPRMRLPSADRGSVWRITWILSSVFSAIPGRRNGWLSCIVCTSVFMEEPEIELSCLDLYFVEQDGKTFKGSLIHKPYFLVKVKVIFQTLQVERRVVISVVY